MNLHDLTPPEGSNEKSERKGRGRGAPRGESGGRGTKGQKKRNTVPIYFEGGQTPIYRRFPKRGFNHYRDTETEIVNVRSLNRFNDGEEVKPERLLQEGLIVTKDSVKLLGDGELSVELTVRVHQASEGAIAKVEKAGGSVDCLEAGTERGT